MVIDDRVEINIEGGVADVRLQRPEKMNALDRRMFKAIAEAGRLLAEDSDVRVVVVSGEGRAFCAGLDTSSVTDSADKETEGGSLNSLEPRTHGIANLFQCAAWVWRDLPVPVIAAVIAGKNPEAIRANKRLYNLSHQLSAEEGLLMESVEQDKIMGTANQLEAVLAQIEGRAPTFNQTVT